jgi:hypothetical protein
MPIPHNRIQIKERRENVLVLLTKGVSGQTGIDVPSGFIDMNGPKVLEAVWVHDLTYLGVISGAIAITTVILGTGRYLWIRRRPIVNKT